MLRCLAGEQPEMPAWPVIPGYALTGVVVERGPETAVDVGTHVVCAGTQRDLVTVVAAAEEAPQTNARFLARDPALMTAAFRWT